MKKLISVLVFVLVGVGCGRLTSDDLPTAPEPDVSQLKTEVAGGIFATLTANAPTETFTPTETPTVTDTLVPTLDFAASETEIVKGVYAKLTASAPTTTRTSVPLPRATRLLLTPTPSPIPVAPTQTSLPSGYKYLAPEPVTRTIHQVAGQIMLSWNSVGSLSDNEQYFVEITADQWSDPYIVCSLLTASTQLLLPPTNSPPCRTFSGPKQGPWWWWHDDYNFLWRISVVRTDESGTITQRLSDYDGGYIFWKHQ